jgi:hypothetical protein
MNLSAHAALVIIYLVPIALATWWIVRSPHRRRTPLVVALLALPLFYAAHYRLLEELQGWPSGTPLPDQFRLLAHEIVEPNQASGAPGRILIWAQPDTAPQPRVYRLPYDKVLHEQLTDAAERQARGRVQRGERNPTTDALVPADDIGASPGLRFLDDLGHRPPAKPLQP